MSFVLISGTRFRTKQLRCNELFQDASIHDVWAFDLPTGRGHTLADVRQAFRESRPTRANWKVRLLFGLRFAAGKVLGLDRPPAKPDVTYLEKLTADDIARSTEQPGTEHGGFRTLYVFEREAADEISNRTVHAVSVMALEPLSEGYTVYWAILLRRHSGFYMRLIDAFRRRYVYPGIIERLRRHWLDRYPQSTTRDPDSTRPR